jgi:hypothetical protein
MKKPKTTHEVILEVDTVGLQAGYDPGKTDLNDFCQFIGQNPNDNIELFTTYVGPGDKITWSGKSTSSDVHTVDIVGISRQTGKDLLDVPSAVGLGKMNSKVKKKYKKNDWEKYNLFFKISGTGVKYEIDPIINIYR